MRRYKAYDKITKEILDVINIDYRNNEVTLLYKDKGKIYLIRKFEDVDILEDTLINDIDRKRIYTGYIIKYKGGVGEVVYKDSGYFVKNLETQNAVLALRQCIEINWGKIIGNIYQIELQTRKILRALEEALMIYKNPLNVGDVEMAKEAMIDLLEKNKDIINLTYDKLTPDEKETINKIKPIIGK